MTVTEILLVSGAAVALGALALSVFVLREAVRDLDAVNRAGLSNGRRYVATRAVVSEVIRVAVLTLLAAAAFTAYIAVRYEVDTGPAALSCFLVAQVGLAADAVHGLHVRRRITGLHR